MNHDPHATPWQRIRLADVPDQPWRNGGGRTRELLAWPSAEAWRLRISVATIEQDGPFSAYPGVQRWLAVVSGPGLHLDHAGRTHTLTAGGEPLAFDGGQPAQARLAGGPTQDLNLMLHGLPAGGMQAAVPGRDWRPPAGAAGIFTRTDGQLDGPAPAGPLPAGTLLWCGRYDGTAMRWNGPAGGAWWLWADTTAPTGQALR